MWKKTGARKRDHSIEIRGLNHLSGQRHRYREVFLAALKLGMTSFGGPIAHIGFFRDEYVQRRKWLDERTFADMVGLCQMLPGPSSSQLGIGIGLYRAGWKGAVLAWLAFTLPSAVAMAAFALIVQRYPFADASPGWLRGLHIAALAVVAQAVWGMARTLAPDAVRGTLAIGTAVAALLIPGTVGQIVPLVCSGLLGLRLFRTPKSDDSASADGRLHLQATEMGTNSSHRPRMRWAYAALSAFIGCLLLLPLLRHLFPGRLWLALADSFYRAGSLVFGGGHVLLPMLEQETVSRGWLAQEQFMAGYGAVQAVPGPMFTFSAYIGALAGHGGMSVFYAALALTAIFLPSFLLIAAAIPHMHRLREHAKFRAALTGVNASVVGILLAALYDPVWVDAVRTPLDFCIALAAFAMLALWKAPPWIVVLFAAFVGIVLL
ncbi:chromate efflux transporter [Paenibacillus sp. MSJ-34]|nr:chromate efflux transporter [Paenibacillus sp. MSJ-34]